MNTKKILSLFLSASLFAPTFGVPVFAQSTEANTSIITPQMTYVDYDDADTSFGYIAEGDTAVTGYNKFSEGTISMANVGWAVNKISYLKIDASAVTDTSIISAVLSMEVSGSTDSKRVCQYGAVEIPYTDWDDTLTYNNAVLNGMTSGTAVGSEVGTSTKRADEFETKTIDITDALKNDEDRIITLAIYETAAGGGYIKNPSVEITHIDAEEYTVEYNLNGNYTYETVYGGSCVSNIPDPYEAAEPGFNFIGWAKDGDVSKLYTTEEISEMEITADTSFTAQYEQDENYMGITITAEPDVDSIYAAKEEQIIVYKAAVSDSSGTVLEDEEVVWTVSGTDDYSVSENECSVTIPAESGDMEITVTAESVSNASAKASKHLTVIGYTGEVILGQEAFETSSGGFEAISNTVISTSDASSDGMSGKVLNVIPEKSGSSAYTAYQKTYDESITSQQFITLEFDIAAQYRDGKDRGIYFGAYDTGNNPLFSLYMKETSAASIAVNNQAATEIEDMLPNTSAASVSGTSYHVSAEFNFFTKTQHIKITASSDPGTVLLDENYDISNAENLGKLGMPEGVAWIYGAVSLDNLVVKIPALHKVSFSITDNNSAAVNNAIVTIYGADGQTKEITSVNGIAETELPHGDYTYTINGHPGQCTSITKPVAFTVSDEDITEEIELIAFDGPTANKIELTADNEAASINAGKEEQKITYTVIIRDQDESIMNDEGVVWTVTGTDTYTISGEKSGSTCTIIIPAGAPKQSISVTASSKTFDFLTAGRNVKVIGYPETVTFKNAKSVIQIPDEGVIHSEYTAVVKDSNGNKLKNSVTYELTDAPSGVSVDRETGVITIESGAAAGAFILKAYVNGAEEVFAEKQIELAHDAPSGLMTDLRQEPAGVSKTPKFSWIMNSYEKDRKQTAYRIIVSSTLENINNDLGDLWDSGKVESDASTNIEYSGNALRGNRGYYWKVKTWDNAGNESPYSEPQRFFTAADQWTASAIWTPADSGLGNVIFARRSFDVDKGIENALLNITASSNSEIRQFTYRAYINGEYVGLGPQFKTYNNQYYYNSFDVTDYITEGENVIGAICYALSDKKLMAELIITYNDGTSETIKTDDTWRVLDGAKAYGYNGESIGTTYYTAMAENIDANYYPYGWNMAGYDDSSWSAPEIKTQITGLTPSSVDPVGEYEVSPVSIEEKSKGHYFIDLGKEITGGIELEFEDIETPAKLEMRYGEELSSENTVMYEMRTGNKYLEYFTMSEGDQTFKNFGMKSFRYIEILNCPVEITKDNIKGIAIRQEFDDDESYFRSDNELLNEIYELCKYSIKATTQDMLVDSQTRERGPYEGDLYVNQLSMYSFMRNYNVPRFTNEALAYGPTWPEEYHQMTVMSAWEDYMYTGDTTSLEKLYPVLKGKLLDYDTKFSSEYNLYQSGKMGNGGTGQVLVDWPNSQRDGYVSNETDYNTVVNAFHYAAASDLANIADVLGYAEDAAYYSDLAAKIKDGMKQLYVPSEKRFADGMSEDGVLTEHYSQHASFFPLALGVVDDVQQKKDIAEEIGADGILCSIYATQFLLSAMYNAGNADDALAMLTSTTDGKSWYHTIYNLGATIVPECWDTSQKGNMTFSHAWGTSPANIIVRNLCGITPIEAGYGKIQIKPQLGGLSKAEVKAPNIKGYVYMSIDTEERVMDTNIPANTTAIVYVPFADNSEQLLYMDGKPVGASIENGYYVVENVGSGAHTFTVGEAAENNISYSVEDEILKSVTVSASEPADLYVATYADNILINVQKFDINSTEETVIPVDTAISEDKHIKLYLWKKDSMRPLCNCETVMK